MSVPSEALNELLNKPSFFQRIKPTDWVWAALVVAGGLFAFVKYAHAMDIYEQAFLILAIPSMIALGWSWRAFQPYSVAVTILSLLGISLYSGVYANGETVFGLKYLFSSQSAVMWMSALFVLATLFYFGGLFTHHEFTLKTASAITWTALVMGFVGLMVRWYESYLVDPEFGHIPVSNLYEVFILFCVITGLLYMYYEGRYRTRTMGGFVLLVISAAVAFLLWYAFTREADQIRPLVPALKSYWMKIHVPANFIGYGAFALAAMTSTAYLVKYYYNNPSRLVAILVPSFIFAGLFLWILLRDLFGKEAVANPSFTFILSAATHAGMIALVTTALLAALGYLLLLPSTQKNFPSLDLLEDITYKAIALGFAFFTVATILGAMWAAEAWGGYWSWDPKETWALIVWLNYAAWLHFRFSKGAHGTPMAWWAVVGLFVTLFAFLGVNMFLSGLHSYGEL
ncbi:c-type cytochrome biogenesis protein CcsB [Thiofilum flexile]|uniref:c-type cytochrome biogenesis protein CcsB n=1 Tax=Thiofilum flexile TaxID=125627 RepID=UPI00036C27ED|nr:c-type cytochrome biogenesis protein CcsB [Thiofilum flexile]